MLLVPLMRMTPPFWMPARREQIERQSPLTIAVRPRLQFADRPEVAGGRA